MSFIGCRPYPFRPTGQSRVAYSVRKAVKMRISTTDNRSKEVDMGDEHADDLLKRALIDAEAAASVALRVSPLTLSEQLTVVFHGRKDLGTIQTYVAHGG